MEAMGSSVMFEDTCVLGVRGRCFQYAGLINKKLQQHSLTVTL